MKMKQLKKKAAAEGIKFLSILIAYQESGCVRKLTCGREIQVLKELDTSYKKFYSSIFFLKFV